MNPNLAQSSLWYSKLSKLPFRAGCVNQVQKSSNFHDDVSSRGYLQYLSCNCTTSYIPPWEVKKLWVYPWTLLIVCICTDFDLRFFLSGMVETRSVILKGGVPKNSKVISDWSPVCQHGCKGAGTFANILNGIGSSIYSHAGDFMDCLLHFAGAN